MFFTRVFFNHQFSILIIVSMSMWSVSCEGFGIALMTVPSEDLAQTICTLSLLRKYFDSVESLSGSVLLISISLASMRTQQNILRAVHKVDSMPWSVVIKNARKKPIQSHNLNEKPQCYFIIVENLEDDDLEYVFEEWQTSLNWNPLAQFVVLLSSVEETNEEMTEMMVEILLSFMGRKIFNVNIIGQSEESNSFYGKSVFPYHPDNNCGNRVTSVELLDVCNYQQSAEDADEGSDDYEDENYDEQINNNDTLTSTEQQPQNETFEENDQDYQSVNQTFYPKLFINEFFRSLFNDKFPKDLSGCPLIAAYRSLEPYIFQENDSENNTDFEIVTTEEPSIPETEVNYYQDDDVDPEVDQKNNIIFNGIEYKMIETVGQHLHLNIEMKTKLDNLYLLFQQLLDGDVEMIVGGIDEDPSTSQFVSTTVPYYQDDLTWCVAKAKRKYNLFSFLESFKVEVWILTLIFVIATTFHVRLTQKFLHIRITNMHGTLTIFLKIFGIVLSQSMPLKYVPSVLKVTFGTVFFMGLIITNIYQSFLVSILTTPKSSYQISHLEEIYHHRMSITGSVENVRHISKEGEIFEYIQSKFEMCYHIEECLNRAAKDETLAVAVSRNHYFYNPRIKREQLYCFSREENLYVYLVTMILPKKFHLIYKINYVIQNVLESGIMQKWASDLDTHRKIDDETLQENSGAFKSLTLPQIGGSFAFMQAFLLLATSVFVLELYIYRKVVQKKYRSKLFIFLHKSFSGLQPKSKKNLATKIHKRHKFKKSNSNGPIYPFIN